MTASHMASINSTHPPRCPVGRLADWLASWMGNGLTGWLATNFLYALSMNISWQVYVFNGLCTTFFCFLWPLPTGPFFLATERASASQVWEGSVWTHYVHWQSFVTPAFITASASIFIISRRSTHNNRMRGILCPIILVACAAHSHYSRRHNIHK